MFLRWKATMPFSGNRSQPHLRWELPPAKAIFQVICIVILLHRSRTGSDFIYFQF